MPFCGGQIAVRGNEKAQVATTLRCRSWQCADCAPNRAKQLTAVGISGKPDRFLTLTSRRRDGLTPIEAARLLAHAWRRIRRQITENGKKQQCEFLAVFEKTKLGWPHLHILIRGPWIDAAWISKRMAEETDSPIIKLEKVTNRARIAGYVAKYISKDTAKFGTLKRYWSSKKWELRKQEKPEGFPLLEVTTQSIHSWSALMTTRGYQVQIVGYDRALALRRVEN